MAAVGNDLVDGTAFDCLEHGVAVVFQIRQSHAGGLARLELPLFRGQDDAGRAADDVEAARSDDRLVEVVEVVAEISLRGPVGAEVFQVQVAGDQDVRTDIQGPEFGPVPAKQVIGPPEERERVGTHLPQLEPQKFRLAVLVELEDRAQDPGVAQCFFHG